jgi:predicted transcriptional regulator
LKKKYVITLEDDDTIFVELNLKEKIYDMLPMNKETISSLVAKSIGCNSRRALEHLTSLESDGLLTSRSAKVRMGKAHVRARVFKRIK